MACVPIKPRPVLTPAVMLLASDVGRVHCDELCAIVLHAPEPLSGNQHHRSTDTIALTSNIWVLNGYDTAAFASPNRLVNVPRLKNFMVRSAEYRKHGTVKQKPHACSITIISNLALFRTLNVYRDLNSSGFHCLVLCRPADVVVELNSSSRSQFRKRL